jgi:hypothetical protein
MGDHVQLHRCSIVAHDGDVFNELETFLLEPSGDFSASEFRRYNGRTALG